VRCLQIVFLITHWAACAFWYEARHVAFDPDVLIGVNAAFMAGLGVSDQYLVSLYWAVTTLSMVEANSEPDTLIWTLSATVRSSLFLLFNITLGSYILGTITLLLVKEASFQIWLVAEDPEDLQNALWLKAD